MKKTITLDSETAEKIFFELKFLSGVLEWKYAHVGNAGTSSHQKKVDELVSKLNGLMFRA